MTFPKLSFNKDQKVVLIDTETEGLNLRFSRPWQVAIVEYQGNKKINEYEMFPWWDNLQVSKGAAAVTRFNYSDYKSKATPIEETTKLLMKYINDPNYVFVGHNFLGFDIFVIRTLLKASGDWKDWGWVSRVLDTLAASRAYNAGEKLDRENFLASQMQYLGKPPKGAKKATLSHMAKLLEIDVDESQTHNAVYDLILNYGVYNKLIYALEI